MSDIRERIWGLIGTRYDDNQFEFDGPGEITAQSIDDFHQRTLRNAFGRTGLSFDVIDYQLTRRRNPPPQKEDPVRISLVSSKLSIGSAENDLAPVPFEDSRSILMPTENFDRVAWTRDRFEELEEALKFQPDVICFPEFAYPPPCEWRTYRKSQTETTAISRNSNLANDYFDRSSYGRNRHKYESDIVRALKGKGEPFVFIGSFHCAFDYYNLGVIFPLGSQEDAFSAELYTGSIDDENAEKEYLTLAPPVLYRKRFPARRVGEYARTPSNFEFHTFNIDSLNIAVLICSDTLDLNQVFNLARINTGVEGKKVLDLILIPAFNLSAKLVSMCRELSFLTGACVAYVNANDPSPEKLKSMDEEEAKITIARKSEVFVCGFSLDDLAELGGQAAKIIQLEETRTLKSGAVLYNLKLDLTRREEFFDRIGKLRQDELFKGSGRSGIVR